jgi:hypothetical protein
VNAIQCAQAHLDEGIKPGNLVLCGGEDDVLAPRVNKRNFVMAVRESEVEDLRLEDDLVGRLHAAREKNQVVERVDDPRRRSKLHESHIRLPEDLVAG